LGRGACASKKEAEMRAAHAAIQRLAEDVEGEGLTDSP
jgi:dsRNA-specific ribonuclease